MTGATVEYDNTGASTRKKKDAFPIRLNTQTSGSYQLSVATLEGSEEWFKAIQQICASNANSAIDDVVAGLARRSHCIPHRFKETFITLSQIKCKVCSSAIHGRGYRCIREPSFFLFLLRFSFLFLFSLFLTGFVHFVRLPISMPRKVLDPRAP